MISKSVGKVHFEGYPSKVAGNCVVSIGIKVEDANCCVLNKLKTQIPCTCEKLASGSHITALLFAMYNQVMVSLTKTAVDEISNKIISSTCNVVGDEFVISIVCSPQLGAVRRVVKKSLINLCPSNYNYYANNMTLLNAKTNRDNYDYCVIQVEKAIKAAVNVSITGKLFLSDSAKDQMDKISKDASTYVEVGSTAGAKKAPFEEEPHEHMSCEDAYESIKITGMPAVMLKRLIEQTTNLAIVQKSNMLCVYTHGKALPLPKIKDKVDLFMEKHKKFEPFLANTLGYIATLNAEIGPLALAKFVKSSPTTSSIAKEIKSTF